MNQRTYLRSPMGPSCNSVIARMKLRLALIRAASSMTWQLMRQDNALRPCLERCLEVTEVHDQKFKFAVCLLGILEESDTDGSNESLSRDDSTKGNDLKIMHSFRH